MFTMHFYVSKNADGLYHIQNAVAGYLGQHHVHTEDSYNEWRKKVSEDSIELLKSLNDCACGLTAGQVKQM